MAQPPHQPTGDPGHDGGWALLDAAPDAMLVVGPDGIIARANRQAVELFGYTRDELVDQPVELLLPARFRTTHVRHRQTYASHPHARPMGSGLRLSGLRKDGKEFRVEISLSPSSSDEPGFTIAAVRDVTERVRAAEQLQRHEQLLTALADLRLGLLRNLSPAAAFEDVCAQARLVTGADLALVLTVEPGGQTLGVAAAAGAGLSARGEVAVAGAVAEALRTGRCTAEHAPASLTLGAVTVEVGAVMAALLSAETTLGVVLVANRSPAEAFDPQDMAMLEAFAHEAALTIELSEARRDRDRLAMLEDRERIGRDLHDMVIQRLFATGMGLQAVLAVATPESVAERIAQAVDDLDETIRDIRNTIFELSEPPVAATVTDEVNELVRSRHDSLGFWPKLTIEGPLDALEGRRREHLLATIGEALSNISRHAEASEVTVEISVGDQLDLVIADNGVGLPAEPRAGEGLENMQWRAAALGGACSIGAASNGKGTRISWTVPLAPPDQPLSAVGSGPA